MQAITNVPFIKFSFYCILCVFQCKNSWQYCQSYTLLFLSHCYDLQPPPAPLKSSVLAERTLFSILLPIIANSLVTTPVISIHSRTHFPFIKNIKHLEKLFQNRFYEFRTFCKHEFKKLNCDVISSNLFYKADLAIHNLLHTSI